MLYIILEVLVYLYIELLIINKVKLIVYIVKCVVFFGCGRDF